MTSRAAIREFIKLVGIAQLNHGADQPDSYAPTSALYEHEDIAEAVELGRVAYHISAFDMPRRAVPYPPSSYLFEAYKLGFTTERDEHKSLLLAERMRVSNSQLTPDWPHLRKGEPA